MRVRHTSLLPLLTFLLLGGGLAFVPTAVAEAGPAASLTTKALRNAPISGVCGGWKGHFTNGKLSDASDYQSVYATHVRVGDLDRKRGRDGALVVSCGTRMPYSDYIAIYTPDAHGRPHLRAVKQIPKLDRRTRDYGGFVTRLRIEHHQVIARWDAHQNDDYGSNSESGVVPTIAHVVLRKAKMRVVSLDRRGARWLTHRFANAMRHKHYRTARKIAPNWLVKRLKGYPTKSWAGRFSLSYGDWQPGDDRYRAWAYFPQSVPVVESRYNEDRDKWRLTGGY